MPTDERYYDKYDYGTSADNYYRGILGDATKEMGPFQSVKYKSQTRGISSWYDDDGLFLHSGAPWLSRGGSYYYGTCTGVFAFLYGQGEVSWANGFRLVLTF